MRKSLEALAPEAAELGIIVADCHDDDAVRSMVSQTKVIATTVGPYASYVSMMVCDTSPLLLHRPCLSEAAQLKLHLLCEHSTD